MQRLIALSLCLLRLAGAAAAQDAPPEPADAAELPLTQVVLFSSGVGYYAHAGQVSGDATVTLEFRPEQINDILKSLVVLAGEGEAPTVTYASLEPLERALQSFGVDISANPSLGRLLNQLRGAEVILQGPGNVRGRILGVQSETRQLLDPPAVVTVESLNILTEAGSIVQLPLASIGSLELVDDQLQAELAKALTLLAQSRDTNRKTVQVRFPGAGQRDAALGYIIEAPVWKTSYRLVLDDENGLAPDGEEAEKPLLQGWAIVENTSDADWTDVQLSLVSGRPISFIQDLYQPLYIPRPVVQPERYAWVRPQMDRGAIEERAAKVPLGAPAPMAASPEVTNRRLRSAGVAMDALEADKAFGAGLAGRNGLAEQAAMAQGEVVGELFAYHLDEPVTLPRKRSAMLAILNQDVAGEKMSLYNSDTLANHPLNALFLTNDTELNLLAGPVTIYAGGTYAGDAQLDNLPPGDERLLSYAVDLKIKADPGPGKSDRQFLSARIVRGVLQLQVKHVQDRTYTFENTDSQDRQLVVEHPIAADWELIEPATAWRKTPSHYRFRLAVPAGQTEKLTVAQQRIVTEAVAIGPTDVNQLLWYSRNARLSPEAIDALARAIELKNRQTALARQVEAREQDLKQIEREQERIRQNMAVLDRNSPVYRRYVEKFDEQETTYEQTRGQIDELRQQLEQARQALEEYLQGLNVG